MSAVAPPPDLATETAAIAAALAAPGEALGARIATARAGWPGDLRLRLLEGEWLEKRGRIEAAEAAYRAAAAAHPANPWPAARIVGLLLARGQAEAALALFAGSIWTSDLPEAARGALLSRLLAAMPDLAARAAFLTGLLRGTAEDRFALLKLAALRFRARDRAGAARLFEEARRYGPLPVESELLEMELHLAGGRFEAAFALAESMRARHPDRIDFMRRAIQAASFAHRLDATRTLLVEALARWPEDWMLLFRYNRAALPSTDDAALFAVLAGRLAARQGDERWLFQHVVAALRQKRTEEARALLPRLAAGSAVTAMAAPLHAALAARPAWEAGRGVSNDAEADVQVVRHPAARATLLVLGGVQGGLGYLPFSHADALLAEHPAHVVYLRDVHMRAFSAGVRGLAADEAGTVAALRGVLADLGGLPAIALGASLGGLAAVRLACQLGAAGAVSFAGPVHLGEAAEGGEGVRLSLTTIFLRDSPGVVEMLRAAPGTRLYQCFGPDYAPDAADAALLAGLDNAVPVEVPHCRDHFVVEHMIPDGSFGRVMARAIAEAGR